MVSWRQRFGANALGLLVYRDFMSNDLVALDETPLRSRRIVALFALLCAHPAAVAVDLILGLASGGSNAVRFLPLLVVIHCDAALFWIWATQNDRRFRRMLIYCCLSSLLALLFFFLAGGPHSGVASGFCESQPGLAILQTVLGLPLIVLLFRCHQNGVRCGWFWLATGGLLLCFGAIASLTGTLSDSPWQRIGWVERVWFPDESLIRGLVICVVNLAAIFFCAAIFESIVSRQRAVHWLGLFGICLTLILVTSWAIGGNMNSMSWTAFGRPPTWNIQWLSMLVSPLSIPIASSMVMMAIAGLFRLLKWQSTSRENVPFGVLEPNCSPVAKTRFRILLGLVRVALSISAANLVVGFLQSWITVDTNRFGRNGLLSELLYMAPHGLWAAQAGLSAVYFQSSILNPWKRLLVVLVWAELSMAAFWGQVALASWMRAEPSEFVGSLFHCVVGGVLVGAVGIAVGKYLLKPPVRVACEGLESPQDLRVRRASLSLGDLITILTAFAAISYPISVVFSLEIWRNPLELGYFVLIRLPWLLAATGAVAIAVQTWLDGKRPSYWCAALIGALLVGCCAHDWATLSFNYSERFFGVRYGFRILALPAMFLATATGAVALKQCVFRVVLVSTPSLTVSPRELARLRGNSEGQEHQKTVVTTQAASPWD